MRIEIEVAFSFKRELDQGYRFLDLPRGADVGNAIREWIRRYPSASPRLLTEGGGIGRHVNALVNGKNVTLREGFRTVLEEGDRLTILPPVGGG